MSDKPLPTKGINVKVAMKWLLDTLFHQSAQPVPFTYNSDPHHFGGGSENMKLLYAVCGYVGSAPMGRERLINWYHNEKGHGGGEPLTVSHGQLHLGGHGAAALYASQITDGKHVRDVEVVGLSLAWLQVEYNLYALCEVDGEPWTPGARGVLKDKIVGENPTRGLFLRAVRGLKLNKLNQYDLGAHCVAQLPEWLRDQIAAPVKKWPAIQGELEIAKLKDGAFYAAFRSLDTKGGGVQAAGFDGKEKWIYRTIEEAAPKIKHALIYNLKAFPNINPERPIKRRKTHPQEQSSSMVNLRGTITPNGYTPPDNVTVTWRRPGAPDLAKKLRKSIPFTGSGNRSVYDRYGGSDPEVVGRQITSIGSEQLGGRAYLILKELYAQAGINRSFNAVSQEVWDFAIAEGSGRPMDWCDYKRFTGKPDPICGDKCPPCGGRDTGQVANQGEPAIAPTDLKLAGTSLSFVWEGEGVPTFSLYYRQPGGNLFLLGTSKRSPITMQQRPEDGTLLLLYTTMRKRTPVETQYLVGKGVQPVPVDPTEPTKPIDPQPVDPVPPKEVIIEGELRLTINGRTRLFKLSEQL